MKNTSVDWGTSWATKRYRGLLAVFPRPFRERYGTQLVRTFRDAASDAMDRKGRHAMLMVCIRMVAELILSAPKEHLVERRQRRRARGATPRAARNVWRDLLHDISYSVRTMRKNATFAVVAVMTLALGIGANTAIFSVVYSVTLRPLPYEAPGELAWLSMAFVGHGGTPQPFPASEPEYLELKDQAQSFTDMAAYLNFTSRVNLGGLEEPQRIPSASVAPRPGDSPGCAWDLHWAPRAGSSAWPPPAIPTASRASRPPSPSPDCRPARATCASTSSACAWSGTDWRPACRNSASNRNLPKRTSSWRGSRFPCGFETRWRDSASPSASSPIART